jgi:hypothetical protein
MLDRTLLPANDISWKAFVAQELQPGRLRVLAHKSPKPMPLSGHSQSVGSHSGLDHLPAQPGQASSERYRRALTMTLIGLTALATVPETAQRSSADRHFHVILTRNGGLAGDSAVMSPNEGACAIAREQPLGTSKMNGVWKKAAMGPEPMLPLVPHVPGPCPGPLPPHRSRAVFDGRLLESLPACFHPPAARHQQVDCSLSLQQRQAHRSGLG